MKRRKGKGSRRKPRGEEAEEQERNARRELLGRELLIAEANARRLRLAWRQRMVRLNLPVAREELEAAWRSFDRAVDDRDYSISVLLDELRISGEQKRRADFAHAAEIDRLLEVYREHLEARGSHYESSVERALAAAGEQARRAEQEQQEKELFLRTLTFSTRLKHDEDAENAKTKNLSKLDGLKEENDNVLRMASVILKRRLRNHSDELAGVLRDHEEHTRERRKDFESLREKDESDQRIIALNAARIEKLYEVLHALRVKIAEFRRQSDKEIADCTFERDYFRAAYFTIQKRLLSEQISDRERLKYLTTEYNKTEEFLKQRLVVVEQILSTVNLCDKYETQEEKLLLYPLSTAPEAQCAHSTLMESDHDHTQQLFAENHPLQKFSRVVSKVNSDVTHLKQSMKNLIEESNQLKCSLKLYMNEVSKPDRNNEKENISTFPVIIDVKNVLS